MTSLLSNQCKGQSLFILASWRKINRRKRKANSKQYYQISNRTLKISQQNCKNISRYYHTSFQGNVVNFYPQSKILQI